VSLLDAAERFAAMDRSAIVLDPARCLHSLDRASTCEACFQICPAEAIAPGKPPSLDADKCESCLACLVVCPVGAYNADDAVRPLLNAVTRLEGQTLELVCAKNPQPEKGISESSVGIRVKGCLAGLGTGTYLALAALGLERVVARTEACSACEWANLRPQIDSQIERAARVLAGWDKGETVTSSSASDGLVERTVWDAENPPLSRRDLFRMMARQGQVAMARLFRMMARQGQVAMARAMENGEHSIGRKPGRDRVRALGAVAHLDGTQFCDGDNQRSLHRLQRVRTRLSHRGVEIREKRRQRFFRIEILRARLHRLRPVCACLPARGSERGPRADICPDLWRRTNDAAQRRIGQVRALRFINGETRRSASVRLVRISPRASVRVGDAARV